MDGDFNVIADPLEYSGGSSSDSGAIANFQECIHYCGFLEPPSSRGPFTWIGVRSFGRV